MRRYLKRVRRRDDPGKSWRAFLANHRKAIVAMDFFTVPPLSFKLLYGFFVIGHSRRRIVSHMRVGDVKGIGSAATVQLVDAHLEQRRFPPLRLPALHTPQIDRRRAAALSQAVFAPNNPRLIMSDLDSESGQNNQKGFMQIYKGAFQGIRNPKAHSLANDLTEEKAAQYLIFASLLAAN